MSNRRPPDYTLNAVRGFTDTLMWAPGEQLDALTLVLALTYVTDISPNVPYVLATGERAAGKSTLTKNIPLLLANKPFIVDLMVSQDAVRNVFLTKDAPKTLLFDDASKMWGESGRARSTNIQTQLAVNAYEDTGKVSVSRNGSTVSVPAYAVCFFNGLGDVIPDDVSTRCIRFPTVKKPEGIRKRGARTAPVRMEAEPLQKELQRWAAANRRQMAAWLIASGHRIHPLLDDRLLQLWGPLFAVAHAAGGEWPRKCMDAFLSLGLDESEKPVLQRDEQALLDTAKIAVDTGASVLFTADLVPALRQLPDAFYRKVDDGYLVGDLLPRALGPSRMLKGKSLDGRTVTGMGRGTAQILRAAADLQEELHPVPEQAEPDAVQRELELTEA
jgi:hypothetical protein